MIKGVVLKYDYKNLSLPITKTLPVIQLLLSAYLGTMHLIGQTVRISMKIFILNKVHFKQLMLAVTVFNINISVQSGIFTLLFL